MKANASLQIGRRRLGDDHPCFVVAEVSGNHGQDYERCAAIVRAAAAAGADAVKFQAYTADTITLDHDGEPFRIPAGNSWEQHGTLHSLYRQACTPWDWFEPLFAQAADLGMEAFCSVFDDSSVELMESLNAPAYKIAAPEITDVPLLRRVAATGKPVILSSGVADLDDLTLAMGTLRGAGCQDIVMLKCTSEYPAPVEQANLRTMAAMRERFGCLTGLSDHTLGTTVPVTAVAVGAVMVEKHLTLDEQATVDSFFSLRPAAFADMVEAVHCARAALGTVDFARQGEVSGTAQGRRSLFVTRAIARGERFTADNVRSVRPAAGLHPQSWDAVMASVATEDLPFGTPLQQSHLRAVRESDSQDVASEGDGDTRNALLSLLAEHGVAQPTRLDDAYRFIDDESLDSFSRIALCLDIEGRFGVTLDAATLLDVRGGSIAGILDAIQALDLQRAA